MWRERKQVFNARGRVTSTEGISATRKCSVGYTLKFKHFNITRIFRKGDIFRRATRDKKKIYPNFKLCGVTGLLRKKQPLVKPRSFRKNKQNREGNI